MLRKEGKKYYRVTEGERGGGGGGEDKDDDAYLEVKANMNCLHQ